MGFGETIPLTHQNTNSQTGESWCSVTTFGAKITQIRDRLDLCNALRGLMDLALKLLRPGTTSRKCCQRRSFLAIGVSLQTPFLDCEPARKQMVPLPEPKCPNS